MRSAEYAPRHSDNPQSAIRDPQSRTGRLTPTARHLAIAPPATFFCPLPTADDPLSRRGVTLLELLVVIIIIVSITAATIPAVLPALANRRVREASRVVNVFIAGARNRAMQTGRPVGVMIERFNGLPEAAMTLSYCEMPLPYAGDTAAAKIHVTNGQVDSFKTSDSGWQGIIRNGDLLKLNYQGHLYRIIGPDTNPPDGIIDGLPWTLTQVTAPPGTPLPGGSGGIDVPFQIFRAPVKLASRT